MQGLENEYLLAIFAPNRMAVEVWDPKTRLRLCSWPCSKSGLLVSPAAPFSTSQDVVAYFFDSESGSLENLVSKLQDFGAEQIT